ncbi:MAG: HAD family hydrolase [Dehalococcoidia bacterium]|nr:HAD family hydrolase [Dehalococcoidia bacterium]
MCAVRAIFLDLDGVLLDPVRVVAEWERLVGDFFARRIGGAPARWALANRRVYGPLLAAHVQPLEDPLPAEMDLGVAWVRALCEDLGRPSPSRSCALTLWRAAEVHVCAHTTATFEGARPVIEALREGYELHTASGNCSWRVDALLGRLGVLQHFEVRFGPDRARAAKHTLEFYRRAFTAARVRPEEALVVDDNAHQLDLARALGARTALVGVADPGAFDLVVTSIEELPQRLATLER